MAREQDFIDKLSDFTSSLEDLVDILQEQQKNSPSEILNKLVDSFDGDVLNTIATDIKEIKKDVKQLNTNSEKTLKAIDGIKSSNETGMFGEIDDTNNKEKIKGAVNTIILIAGGVLAIGMAFKLVGDVDFTSVVALGMGIMFSAYAFSQVASITDDKGKPIDLKRAATTSAIMLLISGAILISGLILKNTPILGVQELLTIVGIGAGLGLATYLILKAVGKLSLKQIAMAGLVPFIMPMISYAIVYSANILTDIQIIDPNKALSAIMVSAAMIPMVFSFSMIVKSLKGSGVKEILMGGLSLVIIALAITVASHILNYGKYEKYPDIAWASGVGLSIVAFSIPMIILGLLAQAGVGLPALALAMIAIPIVVATLVGASLLLPYGTYEKYPSFSWAAGVGLALLSFSVPMLAIGLFVAASFGLGLGVIALGGAAMVLIAQAIVDSSHILKKGDYNKYPGIEWAGGVGGSIVAFAMALAINTGVSLISMFTGGPDLLTFIKNISKAIVYAGQQFSDNDVDWGDNGTYPSKKWAGGVGDSIVAFAKALEAQSNSGGWFSDNVDFGLFIETTTDAIIKAGRQFNNAKDIDWKTNHPDKKWADGVGGSVLSFANAIKSLVDADIDLDDGGVEAVKLMTTLSAGIIDIGSIFKGKKGLFADAPTSGWSDGIISILNDISSDKVTTLSTIVKIFEDISNIDWENIMPIDLVAKSIDNLIIILDKLNDRKIDSLMKLGAGFQLISLVDSDGLEDVLETIDDKTKTLKEVVDDGGFIRNILDDIFNNKSGDKNETSINNSTKSSNDKEVYNYNPFENRVVTAIESISDNVGLMVLNKNTPTTDDMEAENVNGEPK